MTDGLVDEERRLQGRYRLVSPIARGGMAEVWEGVDEILARPVAVKVLHRHLAADDGFRERFRREAVAAARLSHPNVVATYDTGQDGDLPFIVMELVRGRTLRALLDDGGIGPATAVAVAVQVADALAAAHAAGIVHRDVKPGNILLCEGTDVGAAGSVKVADFGIARAATDSTDADLTQPGTVLGTTKYLAPEQVQGGEPDARSDVYALGVVLYEMVTGKPPFAADSPMATAMAHVHQTPMRPRQLRAGIPRSIEAVVLRAIDKDPAARYQSAGELALALRSLDTGADDAVPFVVRDPTPPAGSPAAFGQSERRWLLPAAAIVGAGAVLVSIAVALGGSDVGRTILDRGDSGTGTPEPLAIASVDVLDPTDGVEKNDRLDAIRDADESTSWETSRYSNQEFGGLKEHLGLQLDLGRSTTVRRVTVTSPTSGWSAEIYVAEAASDNPAAWGEPVASRQDVAGSATFDGFDAEGRYVLVLFTRLGSDNRVEVQTVTVGS
ncbi:MAG TPA: protein kinase [Acidimicrobiales bacterium]|nr:protein kinase [Acidimicrobiales bacterium]